MPAIHRSRAEIREIFLQHIPGVDPNLTDERGALAETARRYLRQIFLSARVAISGANFGVAETGSLLVVESEGNGRMCLTVPETLITVMGIEKVIPPWRDLEVFLQLLPRSSTGERINPYSSIWTGITPGDGPQDMHLVLLDNGRTAALADQLGRQVRHCIRCSAGLNVCPVYERTGGHAYGSVYPGPIGAVLSPLLSGIEDNASLPYASTLCSACYDVCPVKIDIPSILVDLRARHVQASRRGPEALTMTAPSVAMRSPRRWRLAERTMVLGRPFSRRGHIHRLPPPLRKWTVSRDLPGAAAAHLPTVVGEAMTAAREEVLARIRAAICSTTPEVVPRAYTGAADEAGAVDLLIDRLLDYRARVDRVSPAGVRDAIAAVGTGPFVVPPGLDTGWTTGLDTIADDRLSSGALDRVAGVITDAALAIAETGTIVLDGGPGQGRRAISLVPDQHVCVVRADQVVPGVSEAIARLDPARPLTLISGPSASSDIELSRVEGVHGPRTLHVIIVDGDR